MTKVLQTLVNTPSSKQNVANIVELGMSRIVEACLQSRCKAIGFGYAVAMLRTRRT